MLIVTTVTLVIFSDSLKWSIVDTEGDTPQARDGHSACVIDAKMYIFGGYEAQVKITGLFLSVCFPRDIEIQESINSKYQYSIKFIPCLQQTRRLQEILLEIRRLKVIIDFDKYFFSRRGFPKMFTLWIFLP